MADLRMLANEENVEVIEFGTKKKYHLASLKPEDFEKRPEIRDTFFWNGVRRLDRFHVPELTKEEYEELAKEFKQTSKFNKKVLKFETATPYYIRKARIAKVAKALGCAPSSIDLEDYIWDERYYIDYSFIQNISHVDDLFREEGSDNRYASANEVYINQDPRTAFVDEKLWNELYYFCTKAIKARKAMLLSKVDKCLGQLISILEYTDGFTANATPYQVASLQSYKTYFQTLFENEEFCEFITKNNDVTVFGADELTHSDYVDTYRAMCKMLIRGTDEDMDFFKDMLTQVEDPYVSEILEVKNCLEFRSIYDDADACEDDDILD